MSDELVPCFEHETTSTSPARAGDSAHSATREGRGGRRPKVRTPAARSDSRQCLGVIVMGRDSQKLLDFVHHGGGVRPQLLSVDDQQL